MTGLGLATVCLWITAVFLVYVFVEGWVADRLHVFTQQRKVIEVAPKW